MYVAFVLWDQDHFSPWIGPFETHGQAEVFAKEMRKRLRARGYEARGLIKIAALVTPETALSWGPK